MNVSNNLKIIQFFLIVLFNLSFSQTIINTENMMKELDSDLSYNLSFQLFLSQ